MAVLRTGSKHREEGGARLRSRLVGDEAWRREASQGGKEEKLGDDYVCVYLFIYLIVCLSICLSINLFIAVYGYT